MAFQTIQDLVALAQNQECAIWQIVMETEEKERGIPGDELLREMARRWQVMLESIESTGVQPSMGGLVGGDAARVARIVDEAVIGRVPAKVIARALAAAETNAAMGRIVAAPTAGSCGILPAVLSVVAEETGAGTTEVAHALLTAAGVGMVIAKNASISGADGGCQAECGAAAAMAAAAAAELLAGDPVIVAHAAALALKNLLGLVCDPVAGLVEVPCVKRNAFAAVHALTAAQMAVAGVQSVIPPDEVIWAMHRIGKALPEELRETGRGGLAVTPTGKKLAAKIHDAVDQA
ncbi:MAG: L-serine ammonia-lyase, iron-sulfur-dependent, subunit alpha [Bacillota bacterium]